MIVPLLILLMAFSWPTNLAQRIGHGVREMFAYDATEPKGRRKAPQVRTASEDDLLDSGKRSKLLANAADINRNFAIAAWMVRRHLDYVSTFHFHARSGDDRIDLPLEQLMRTWSRPYNCDASGRHSFRKMIRLAEARRILDGDVGLLKLRDGRLQGLESDRIRNPAGLTQQTEAYRWVHGVKIDNAGRALAYALHRRRPYGGLEFEKTVAASNLCLLGYYEDRFDQVRGVSPIATALNPLRDVYEGFDYALAKAKVQQLFAMIFFTEKADALGDELPQATDDEEEDSAAASETSTMKYPVDFGRGPVKLELNPGDRAEFLTADGPGGEFQKFTQLVTMVALKALDIPYSFYDESHTNFFGSRGAWLHYERSCAQKQEDLLELLQRITLWRIALWILDGELQLPRGMTIGDLDWEWVPAGMPWWDPAKEIRGDLMAIGAGLDNPQRITKERGRGDWYENIDEIAKAKAYAESKGVALSFTPDAAPVEVVTSEN